MSCQGLGADFRLAEISSSGSSFSAEIRADSRSLVKDGQSRQESGGL